MGSDSSDFELIERKSNSRKRGGSSSSQQEESDEDYDDEDDSSFDDHSECESDTTLYGMIEESQPFACLKVMI